MKEKKIAQHSSASNEAYTPLLITGAARLALGGKIELDPGTTELANEELGAERIFTIEDNALTKEWRAKTAFVNPPGGVAPTNRVGTRSNAALWWWKLWRSWASGRIGQAIFVGFTLEILSTTQRLKGAPSAVRYPKCFYNGRIMFDVPRPVVLDNGVTLHDIKVPAGRKVESICEGAKRYPTKQATHANTIIYLPPVAKKDREKWRPNSIEGDSRIVKKACLRFWDAFTPLGEVKI